MKFLQSLIMLLFMSLCANAGDKYEWKEGSGGGYTYKYVTNDPMQARYYTLKNGLTVILSPISKNPRMQVYIATKAGSKTDPADHTGLAHYLEHMLFKGTQRYGSKDWAKEKPYLDMIDALYEKYNHTTDEKKRKVIYHQIDSVSGVASKYAIANEYDKMMSSIGAQGTNAFTSFEQTVYTEDAPANAVDAFLKVQAERFKNPVFRIFHTELEAVYEEKNRSLDNDFEKSYELLMENLYRNHNYGKQTTIGTIDHLKNPSLLEIRNYFNKYYVPNNMGIIIAGDFNPDVMIKKVDENFAYMQPKPVAPYTFSPEAPITAPISKEVVGPDAESVYIGYRLPGQHSKDALIADLVGQILTNGRAGLIDQNLVRKQKLLRASASADILVDYGYLYLTGRPTMGQSLDEVKNLILGEIENLKKGNFDDDLITAIVNNQKKYAIMQTEDYGSRASVLMSSFTSERNWLDDVAYVDMLSKLTKKDITDFANKYFGNNYVVVYKRQGEDKTVSKVDKPPITPVETNAGSQSDFVKEVINMPVGPLKPVWIDYNKDMQKDKLGPAQILYVQNTTNGLFRLTYRYNMGTWHNRKFPIAAQYLQLIGTDKMSAEDVSKEFYKLACNFNMGSSNEFTFITLEGLSENFDKAVALLENLLANCKADEKALASLKSRLEKSRADAKKNKGAIMQGLSSYARFGAQNPYNNVLSNDELKNLTGDELVNILHSMNNYKHRILYYGPETMSDLKTSLAVHQMPEELMKMEQTKHFAYQQQDKNQVLFANYDMVQSEIRWVRNVSKYDPALQPTLDMFNNYFGGNMGAIVFQTIRESKALAYSTSSYVITPEKKDDPYYISAYVGCQADKFNESIKAMNELLDDLPAIQNSLMAARSSLKKDIETERITQDGIIYNYLTAKRRGLDEDVRKNIYESADKLTYDDLKKFHTENMSHKPYTYCIVANEAKVKMEDMQKCGDVKKLSLEEIFGY
jgi:predicted Zn-dependent peptidase